MQITIQHREDGHRGSFFVEQDGQQLAEMTYVWSGTERIIIDHTEVSDALRGTGTGKKLVQAGADFARSKGIKVLPLCPFAKKVMESDASYADILNG